MTKAQLNEAILALQPAGWTVPTREHCLFKLLSIDGEVACRLLRTCHHILTTGDYSLAVRSHFIEERRVLWAIFPESPFAKKDGQSLPSHLKDSPVTCVKTTNL